MNSVLCVDSLQIYLILKFITWWRLPFHRSWSYLVHLISSGYSASQVCLYSLFFNCNLPGITGKLAGLNRILIMVCWSRFIMASWVLIGCWPHHRYDPTSVWIKFCSYFYFSPPVGVSDITHWQFHAKCSLVLCGLLVLFLVLWLLFLILFRVDSFGIFVFSVHSRLWFCGCLSSSSPLCLPLRSCLT